jgi:hypothetical protein
MKILFSIALVVISFFITLNVGAAEKLNSASVTVQLYNQLTGLPQASYNVGDTVGYTVTASLPASVDSKQAAISVKCSLKLHGMKIPVKLSQSLSAPVSKFDKKTGTVGSVGNIYTPVVNTGSFVIPMQVSGASASIKAKLSINGVGAVSKVVDLVVN